MPTVTDIGSLIVRSEDIHGNRPRVAGTGVTVRRIVGWYKQGLTPEEITTEVSHLSLAQVYAALTYYHANREQIEADIAVEDTEAKQLKAQHDLHRNARGRFGSISTKISCGMRPTRSAPVASMCRQLWTPR
jgi:uncharacterized protein (DUF433 family)